MIVFHVMVHRFCPVQNAALCEHTDFDDYAKCPVLGSYNCLVSPEGHVHKAIKESGEYSLVGAYFGSWQIVGYLGVAQTVAQAEVMRQLFNSHEADHRYGPGIHALGMGTCIMEQFEQEMDRLRGS